MKSIPKSKIIKKIDKILNNSHLFYLYKNLLTQKQIQIFEFYFFEDFSLIEIANQLNISKNGVYDTLSQVDKILEEVENKLEFSKRVIELEAKLNLLETQINDQKLKNLITEIKNIF